MFAKGKRERTNEVRKEKKKENSYNFYRSGLLGAAVFRTNACRARVQDISSAVVARLSLAFVRKSLVPLPDADDTDDTDDTLPLFAILVAIAALARIDNGIPGRGKARCRQARAPKSLKLPADVQGYSSPGKHTAILIAAHGGNRSEMSNAFIAPAHHLRCAKIHRHSPFRTTICPVRCEQTASKTAESDAITAAAATFILQRAAKAYTTGGIKPAPVAVAEAMAQLEKAQKRSKATIDGEKILGQWRLVFIANPRRKPAWFRFLYFPIRAHQTFTPPDQGGEFDNAVHFGVGKFRVTGPFRWIAARNRMEFTVNRFRFELGPLKWAKDERGKEEIAFEDRHVRDLPFFTFFLLRDNLAAARGRSGGLALYAKVPQQQEIH
ncbi:hypothetical protein FGB62_25g552 [Gracilaria domingensis]|nr:hypothetical protein FGB62_25g552 [Gracilaria domingensis]